MNQLSRAWAEISLKSVAVNYDSIRSAVKPETKIMCVVKADAYGHGVEGVVPILLEKGADMFAVASLDEGIQLRRMGVRIPILILGYTDPVRTGEVLKNDLAQTVFSTELAKALSEEAVRRNTEARIHIKIDTGMSRFGLVPEESSIGFISEICALPNICADGIYTHFASADSSDPSFTETQYAGFLDIINKLEAAGLNFKLKHACNSAALLRFPHMHLDMVRPGIILYGISPFCDTHLKEKGFEPVLSLKSEVVMVKMIKKGSTVSYGRTYTADRDMQIATISIGYADGYLRALSNNAEVLINGRRFPVIGTICMDACMVDISGSPIPVRSGDEVVLIGRSGSDEITIDELSRRLGSISYETACTIGRRVPRVFADAAGNRRIRNILLGS